MKHLIRGLSAAATLLLSVGSVGAAQASGGTPPPTITFQDAITIALKQNTSVRQAQNATDLNSTSVQQARMNFLPDLRLSVNNGLNVGRTFSQTEGSIVDQTSQSLNTGLSSSVTVFDGFRNLATLNAAKATETASTYDIARTRQTVVFTVASNFLNLVAQQEQLGVQNENLKALELQQEQIQKYVDAGVRPISDLYQQQAATAGARAAVVNAKRAVELAKIDLIQTLQLDAARSYDFVAPDVTEAAAVSRSYDLNALLAQAYQKRADLDAEQARVEAAKQTTRASAAGKWPTISVTGSYSTGFNSAANLGLTDQLDQRRGGGIGIGLSIPLYDKSSASLAEQRAVIQEDNARLDLANQRQQIAVEIRRAYLDHQSAQEQLKAAEAQKVAADQAVGATQERYRVGAATLVELTQTRATQVQAASALVNARYNLVFQDALMTYYTGDLDPAKVSLGA